MPADVLLDALRRQQLAFGRLAARIANEPGAAADDRDRRMAVPLQVRERQSSTSSDPT